VATEAAWLNGNNWEKEEINEAEREKREKMKKSLDTHRPSHGRRWYPNSRARPPRSGDCD
jgi:hypothetical protein